MNYFNESRGAVVEKIKESASSVLPIFVIVLLMCLFIVPIQTDLVLCFVLGAVMLVFGMGFFSLGADVSMTPDKDEKPAADTCHQLFSRLRGNNRRAGSAGACRNRPAYQQLCSPCDGRRRRRLVSVGMHVPHSHRSESPLDPHCRICHRFRTCDIHRP